MSDARATEVLDQLGWLIDEIQAQKPFLNALPDVQLNAVPFEGEVSIRALYDDLYRRERNENLSRLGMNQAAANEDDATAASGGALLLTTMLDRLVVARKQLIKHLSSIDDWSRPVDGEETMLEFAHRIALDDAETLREIGRRFYESNVRFSRS